jgi:hypothetical protein
MAKIIETYNPQKIEIIKRMLEKQSSKGSPLAYEVFVDNFKVVMKTTDLSEFDSYEDVMTNDTKYIRINVYNSPAETISHTKYVFEVEERKPQVQQALGEVTDINAKIKESIAVERERWDRDQLMKELDRTKLELQEAEEYIDELTDKLEKVKQKPNHFGKLDLGSLAGSAIEGVMRRNPQWLTKVPGLEGLAGVIVDENTNGKRIDAPTEETEVTVTKASSVHALTEEEKSYLAFGKEVAENFEDEEISVLMKIIHQLSKDTSQLKTVAELLNVPA